jgi:hypothetical protein
LATIEAAETEQGTQAGLAEQTIQSAEAGALGRHMCTATCPTLHVPLTLDLLDLRCPILEDLNCIRVTVWCFTAAAVAVLVACTSAVVY